MNEALTVAQLIEKLKQFPPDKLVAVQDCCSMGEAYDVSYLDPDLKYDFGVKPEQDNYVVIK